MDKRNVAFLCSVFLMLVGPLLAQSGPAIYVSTYTGRQILRVDGTTGAVTAVYTGSSNFLPEDVTVGPDNRIYVCDPTNGQIIRMNDNGTNVETVYNQPTGGPEGPRFNSAGTLFFNTKGLNPSGVWKIDGLSAIPFGGPFPVPVNVLKGSGNGEGLAFTNNGDLLVVNRSSAEVQRSLSLSPPPASAKTLITGLNDPIGIAVNSVDEIFVARGNSLNDIQRYAVVSNNWTPTTYVSFSATDQPVYLEFVSDDTLFVGTADAAMQNGKLWKVTPPVPPATTGSKTLVAALPKKQGKYPPAVGVGVPATSKSITKKDFTGTQAYNFGPHSFEVTAGPCAAKITARQRPPAEVNSMLAKKGINGKGQPLSGEEGWVTTWLIEPQPDASGCLPGPDGFYGIAIAAFVDKAFDISPGIIKCDVSSIDGSWTGCTRLQDFGYYPEGPILGGPGDPVTTTKSRSFSEYLFVNLALEQNGNFCGFQSPLSSDPNSPAVFNIGKTITFKFQLTTGPGCTGSFITDAKAVLSIAQIELGNGTPTFDRKVIKTSGNSSDPPFFRNDNPSKSYVLNLDTSGWTAGLYAATMTSNKALPQLIQFRLR